VVVACGRDRHLRSIIENTPQCTALGWTDEMPSYMAAADVVVENAGGLSSLEALASGVPIVSFDPIPGHGRDNVRAMTRAGITSAPESLEDLVTIVSRLSRDTPERRRQLAAVEGMFTRNPIDPILDLIGTTSRM
jgi:UDP-N-acetylglucosamine:LPS N-acetylglucosamine transferase